MISLSDAKRFSEESPAIKNFKPWWEIIIDYMLLALLLICLLAWARVTSLEASGLVCVPIDANVTYGFTEYRYANSRCSQEFETKLVLYYPYLLFSQWLISFLVQRTWLKVPVVMTKLDAFHNIFYEMCLITPTFKRNKHSFCMLPEIIYEDESYNKVKVLHDKLMFLLTEKSYLLRIYRAKVLLFLGFSTAFVIGMVFWLYHIKIPKADIPCNLIGDENAREFNNLICNFSSAFFSYSAMCLNFILLCLVIAFSSYGFYWSITQSSFAEHTGIFGQMIDLYTGLPGFNDLQFCMSLVRSNVRDGNITFEIIKSCLKQEARQLEEKSSTSTVKGETVQRSRDFGQEYAIVRLILQHLCLEIIENNQDSNHLFDCLDYIRSNLSQTQLDISTNLRSRLTEEVQRNPLYFKAMIDNDDEQPSYDQFIDQMRLPFVFGNQYAVAAAANVFKVRIVLIHCQNTGVYREVFEPFSDNIIRGTFFLAFTGQYYYHATREIPREGKELEIAIQARTRFAEDEKYRNSIRQTASRSIERSEEGEIVRGKTSTDSDGRQPSMTSESSIRLLESEHHETVHGNADCFRRYQRTFLLFEKSDPADYV